MTKYILRRLIYSLTLLVGVMLILFILYHVLGGSDKVVLRMLGKQATQEDIDNLRRQYGFDKSYFSQLLEMGRQCLVFDFGRSITTRQKISSMIAEGAIPSLTLMAPAFFVTVILSITVSLLCAYKRDGYFDRMMVIVSVAGMSISIMAYIILGQYLFAYKWKLFPIMGYEPGLNAVRYIVLPVIIYTAVSLGSNVRLFRTFILNEINQDYVRTARAKGVSVPRLLFKHVLKNAMIPIITQVVIEIPFLIMGSLLLENFFSIPGLGSMSIDALANWDLPVLRAVTFLGSLMFILGNLLSDILYAFVDPRIRFE
ncbi:MAG TPA: ABC transporter permease [Candidatus Sumerlaeota bacterium]|nr:ABC transporter permease [Candidatus Sumerlaeota bacterium]HON51049.1 ABC transporter permease [Candidatus Sumerlaeota bacterium]HOR65072.1 ABC transporter permease [Candidatus Sumerlaeota bacterium]HPL74916.1 ABC transporter permease [Candidatus Sumerlaeota bacterium]HRU53033.1 ABC transporter permease [Candidatus Sumerlaeia bacterium]